MAGSNQLPPGAGAGSNQLPPGAGAGSNQLPFNAGDQSPSNGHFSPFNGQSSPTTFPSDTGSPDNYYPSAAGHSYSNFNFGNNLSPAETGRYSSGYPYLAGSRSFSARNHQPSSGRYINSGNPLPPSDGYIRNGFLDDDYISGNSSYGSNPFEWDFMQLRLSSIPDPDLQRIRAQSAARTHSAGWSRTSSFSPRSVISPESPVSGHRWSEFRGRILTLANDQSGSRYLQSKFGNPEDVHIIFLEIKDHVSDLMVEQFGNQFIQKFLAVADEKQMNHILLSTIKDEKKFKDICTDMHGTRAVQKLIENLTSPTQRTIFLSGLRRLTLPLIKNHNGAHVIQHCLKYFPSEDIKLILSIVANNCIEVATDKSGCCVIQHCLTHSLSEPTNRLMSVIIHNAFILSQHPYGNYVVQFVLGFRMREVTWGILSELSGNFVLLSMNKYGSNVVENCLRQSMWDQAIYVIEELMDSPDILNVFQDPFGNYVAQRAIDVSGKDERMSEVHKKLLSMVRMNAQFLHSHPHGKRVLDLAKNRGLRFAARTYMNEHRRASLD